MQHPWDSQQFRAGARAAGRSEQTVEAAIAIARNIKRINSDLPVVLTLHHLSHLCDVSSEFLQDVTFRQVRALPNISGSEAWQAERRAKARAALPDNLRSCSAADAGAAMDRSEHPQCCAASRCELRLRQESRSGGRG